MGHSFLHRYWFDTKVKGISGFGVTAYSVEDATTIVDDVAQHLGLSVEVIKIVEDVDVRDLDQNHVVPNMGPPNFRGVWFPNLNLS